MHLPRASALVSGHSAALALAVDLRAVYTVDTHREAHRVTERHTHTVRILLINTEPILNNDGSRCKRDRHSHTERETHTGRDTYRHRHTHTHTHTQRKERDSQWLTHLYQ